LVGDHKGVNFVIETNFTNSFLSKFQTKSFQTCFLTTFCTQVVDMSTAQPTDIVETVSHALAEIGGDALGAVF